MSREIGRAWLCGYAALIRCGEVLRHCIEPRVRRAATCSSLSLCLPPLFGERSSRTMMLAEICLHVFSPQNARNKVTVAGCPVFASYRPAITLPPGPALGVDSINGLKRARRRTAERRGTAGRAQLRARRPRMTPDAAQRRRRSVPRGTLHTHQHLVVL